MGDEEEKKKGPTELEKQVEAGLAAMTTEVKLELDTAGAEAYKAEAEAKIDAMKAEEAALTGKDNKKARTEKGKQISAAKAEPKYVDALKVLKGLDPPNGNFILSKSGGEKPQAAAAAPAPEEEKPKAKKEEKKEEKPKKEAKPGKITKEELAELDKLKNDIIARKTQLKAEGLSGGQQNKDEQIVAWVTRMNELKEKQDPGSTQKKPDESKKKKGKLSPDDQLALDALKKEIEEYKQKCISEFGMTKKDLKTDPDLMEMEARAAEMEKRAK
jgi:hypothetical protein